MAAAGVKTWHDSRRQPALRPVAVAAAVEDAQVVSPPTYLHFDDMCWPNPDDPADVEWAFRYGTPSPEQMRIATSMIAAYKQLVADSPRGRNSKVSGIRRAASEATGPPRR